MKRAVIQIAMLALAGTLVAQEPSTPPPPPATPATPQATPAPAPRPKPRTHVYTYSAAPTMPSSGSYLGVDVRDLTPDRARELKLKGDQGVEITMVDQDGPACKAGVKEHDVVVSFNGNNVQSAEQLRRMIRETKPGQSISLGIMREGQSTAVTATLADRAKMFGSVSPKVWSGPDRIPMPAVRIPDIEIPSFVVTQSSRRNGVTVENLTSQLGEYFGVKNGEGILVRSVDKGSKAEAAGLKAGDVIIRVDNDRISDTREWSRALRNRDGGTVKLGILRDRREQTLSLALPQRSDESNNWYVGPDLEQLRIELQDMGPQLAKQQAEIQARIARELASHQREMQESMREAQRELERSLRDAQTERDHALRDAQREKEQALREAQREKERALREAQREKERAQREKEKDQQQ